MKTASNLWTPRGGRWPDEPMTRCFLEVDSPCYPPEDAEFAQCDCTACRVWQLRRTLSMGGKAKE